MSTMLDGLNQAQLEAVTHGKGPLVVIAGPGTGKTRVITRRFAWLVEQGAKPDEILALTFSNKAADEMRERIEELIDRAYEDLPVSTFHSFCSKLLHEEADEAGISPFFEPVTDAERLALLLDNIDKLSLKENLALGRPAALLEQMITRINRCKDELITAERYSQWAISSGQRATTEEESSRAEREREFAATYAEHDRLLSLAGALDFGDLIARSIALLKSNHHLRDAISQRFSFILVDEFQDTNYAQGVLLKLLSQKSGNVAVVGDDDQSIYRFRGASQKNIEEFRSSFPQAKLVRLERSYRSSQSILDAAQSVIAQNSERIGKELVSDSGVRAGDVEIWRCQDLTAQSRAIASHVEQLVASEGVPVEEICVLVHSARAEGEEIADAISEREITAHVHGSSAFFDRIEIRDLLAWLTLLTDPTGTTAAVRVLSRPPVKLDSIERARLLQIAKRRRVDLVTAAALSLEQSKTSEVTAERVKAFLRLRQELEGCLDELRPQRMVSKVIESIDLRRSQLFTTSAEALERLVNIAKFQELAAKYERRRPKAEAREFARHIIAVAEAGMKEGEAEVPLRPKAVSVMTMHAAKGLEFDCVIVPGLVQSKMPGRRRDAKNALPDELLKEGLPRDSKEAHWNERRRLLYVAMTRARKQLVLAWPELNRDGNAQKPSAFLGPLQKLGIDEQYKPATALEPSQRLYSHFQNIRDELLATSEHAGDRLAEMRLDTYMDVNEAVAHYLELLKVVALMGRDKRRPVEEVLPQVNDLLLKVANPEQRKIFLATSLDRQLLAEEEAGRKKRGVIASRLEPPLDSLLPKKGEGASLSATDINTYLTCPLKYKYQRVYGIPEEQTLALRFGSLMHQVLEQYHSKIARDGQEANGSLRRLLDLFKAGWRRSGLGSSDEERDRYEKGVAALKRYHSSLESESARPAWFERGFAFQIGPHHLRGRVDRVDELNGGGYELIDYKTGKPKSKSDLKDDIQLPLYKIGARKAWELEASRQSYYYLLDNKKVPVERTDEQLNELEQTITEVGDNILGQKFEPKPSYQTCRWCSFKMICPTAEK